MRKNFQECNTKVLPENFVPSPSNVKKWNDVNGHVYSKSKLI